MADSVYRVTELVGTSETSWEEAAKVAIETASKSLKNLRVAEQTEFQTIPEKNMAKAFCACWTRKEAFIKAIGSGVSYGLDKFDVTVDPQNQTPEINLHNSSDETWSAFNLPINDEYMACLVSDRNRFSVRCWC